MHHSETETGIHGAAGGGVRGLLRAEGLCVLALSAYAYATFGSGWGVFLACFFIPDSSFIAYLAGPRVGAFFYNAAHSYVGPAICLAISMALPSHTALAAGLIWSAHIGFDRTLGYGLKYGRGFSFTHLGRAGRRPSAE